MIVAKPIRKARKMIQSGLGVRGRYKVMVLNANGSVAMERPWKNNLILDQGLNYLCNGTAFFASCFTNCAVGTGTTPTYTDSGAITVTIAAGTATASAPIFSAGMVGMLLVADTGEQQYITAFSSTTVVSVSGSSSVVAQLFTVYAVNQTGLVSESKRTSTYLTGVGNCGTTNNTGTATRTLRRTFDFTAEVSNQNYEELGWSYTSSVAANLFSRTLISGGTVTVLATQQLRVIYDLTILVTPNTSRAETMSVTGWPVAPATNTDGDYIANSSNFGSSAGGLSSVDTSGNSNTSVGNRELEPAGSVTGVLGSGSSLPAFNSNYTAGTTTSNTSSTLQSYVSGNFYRDNVFLWNASSANRTDIRGIAAFTGVTHYVAVFVFDEAQTKDNSHLLEITWRRYVNRVIVNP